MVRQRSRSEPDILGLLDALKMLDEGTLDADGRPKSSVSKETPPRERKVSGGIMVGCLKWLKLNPVVTISVPIYVSTVYILEEKKAKGNFSCKLQGTVCGQIISC